MVLLDFCWYSLVWAVLLDFWSSLVLGVSTRFLMVLVGLGWFYSISDGSRWFWRSNSISDGFRWFWVVLLDF